MTCFLLMDMWTGIHAKLLLVLLAVNNGSHWDVSVYRVSRLTTNSEDPQQHTIVMLCFSDKKEVINEFIKNGL